MAKAPKRSLSRRDEQVMRVIWERGPCTAEDVRNALKRKHPLKDSTVRTILRRLEAKGYLAHRTQGRTYVYRTLIAAENAAAEVVRQLVQRLCNGSVEQLLVGMVNRKVVTADALESLAQKIAALEDEMEES